MIQGTFASLVLVCTTKQQQRVLAKLTKKFSYKSTVDLDNCSTLLTSLYLSGCKQEALQVVNDMLETITFTGNFDLWPDYDFAIAYQIADENGDDEVKQRVHAKLCEVEAFTPAPGKICGNDRYFERILYKRRVTDAYPEIDQCVEEGDTAMEFVNRSSVIFEASLVKAVNQDQDPALTTEMNSAIEEQVEILSDKRFAKYI
ncbi:MAG: hypothetical protein FWD55_07890 [Propionibacteriaceae bacterium]|nr:hypothetical protein [Propionibacteriaceae bacterium]